MPMFSFPLSALTCFSSALNFLIASAEKQLVYLCYVTHFQLEYLSTEQINTGMYAKAKRIQLIISVYVLDVVRATFVSLLRYNLRFDGLATPSGSKDFNGSLSVRFTLLDETPDIAIASIFFIIFYRFLYIIVYFIRQEAHIFPFQIERFQDDMKYSNTQGNIVSLLKKFKYVFIQKTSLNISHN